MRKRQWADEAVEKLQLGQTVQVTPKGLSMQGRVNDGDSVTLAPSDKRNIEIGDIVLARITGRRYSLLVLHLVLDREGDRFLIGNNLGREDGWVEEEDIFGKVVEIQTT